MSNFWWVTRSPLILGQTIDRCIIYVSHPLPGYTLPTYRGHIREFHVVIVQ